MTTNKTRVSLASGSRLLLDWADETDHVAHVLDPAPCAGPSVVSSLTTATSTAVLVPDALVIIVEHGASSRCGRRARPGIMAVAGSGRHPSCVVVARHGREPWPEPCRRERLRAGSGYTRRSMRR